MTCLGRRFIVPKQVHPPQPITILQKSVLREVKKTDRVLDMGTGSGINAILAAVIVFRTFYCVCIYVNANYFRRF
ncbi:MAG: hypothetical protein PXY39_15050 [archaeon]|nr:hypothetical protein [archaeon]